MHQRVTIKKDLKLLGMVRDRVPVKFIQVHSTVKVQGQNARIAHALHSRIHEASVSEVAEPCGTLFSWSCRTKTWKSETQALIADLGMDINPPCWFLSMAALFFARNDISSGHVKSLFLTVRNRQIQECTACIFHLLSGIQHSIFRHTFNEQLHILSDSQLIHGQLLFFQQNHVMLEDNTHN